MKNKLTVWKIIFALVIIFATYPGWAYPTSLSQLVHIDANRNAKRIYIIGDHHSKKIENSPKGKSSLNYLDHFLESLRKQTHRPITFIWEDSGVLITRKPGHVYMLQKAQSFLQQKNSPFFNFVPSDVLRSQDSRLRTLVENLVYRREQTLKKLGQKEFRQKTLDLIEGSLGPQKTKYHLSEKIQLSLAPLKTKKLLSEHIRWFESNRSHLTKALRAYPALLAERQHFEQEFIRLLVYTATDLEILVNVIASKHRHVFVYAGKGHLDRLEQHLKLLNFSHESTPVQNRALEQRDFNNILQSFFADKRIDQNHPSIAALPSSRYGNLR